MERPNKNNVNLGDLLVIGGNGDGNPVYIPITKIDGEFIIATRDNKSYYSQSYGRALVVKNNNCFLIGEQVPDYLLKSDMLTRDKLIAGIRP